MKKLFLFVALVASASSFTAKAQDCMSFFPDREGTTLVSNTYDAKNNLISTMTYKVEKVYNTAGSETMSINFMLTDKGGKIIDSGVIETNCDGGTFYMKMKNRTITPNVANLLSTDTELVGDFLDYPDVFGEGPSGSNFKMSGGEFTIQAKNGDKKALTSVRVYDRKYINNETITTPAKMFNAAKITFNFQVTTPDKKQTSYTGTEWYAPNAGIVRSETYLNNKLVNYTILSEIK